MKTSIFVLGIVVGLLAAATMLHTHEEFQIMSITKVEKEAFKWAEMGYFEGQVDALTDIIKVKKINNCWEWNEDPGFTKDGLQFEPSEFCEDEKNKTNI